MQARLYAALLPPWKIPMGLCLLSRVAFQEAAPIDPGTLQHQSDGVTEVGFVNPYLAGFFAHTPAPLPTPTPPLFINPYRDPQAQPGFDPPLLPRV